MNTTTTTIAAEKKMIVGTKRNRVQENVQETFKLKTTMTPEMIDLMNRGISPSFAFLITSMKKTRKNHRRL